MSCKLKRGISLLLIGLLTITFYFGSATVESSAASGTVGKRINEVRKDFPNNSRIKQSIKISTVVNDGGWETVETVKNGGCNALVAYVTMKVFHEPYIPGAVSYKKVGKTTKGSNTAALKKLFRKAKKGDVIRFHTSTEDLHLAIFMGMTSKGVKVYEGNYGSKHQVKYNHLWTWSDLASSRMTGAKCKVTVYRYRNYSKVNSGKAACNLKKGAVFKHKGITYKVTKGGIRNATVKVVSKDANAEATPKAIGINYETSSRLIKLGRSDWDTEATDIGERLKIRSYKKNKGRYYDEQYFVVKS